VTTLGGKANTYVAVYTDDADKEPVGSDKEIVFVKVAEDEADVQTSVTVTFVSGTGFKDAANNNAVVCTWDAKKSIVVDSNGSNIGNDTTNKSIFDGKTFTITCKKTTDCKGNVTYTDITEIKAAGYVLTDTGLLRSIVASDDNMNVTFGVDVASTVAVDTTLKTFTVAHDYGVKADGSDSTAIVLANSLEETNISNGKYTATVKSYVESGVETMISASFATKQ
jgi:hypothetical protein